jgi:hypothetical protein
MLSLRVAGVKLGIGRAVFAHFEPHGLRLAKGAGLRFPGAGRLRFLCGGLAIMHLSTGL